MSDVQQQITFTVGGNAPDKSLLTIGGRFHADRELRKGEEIHVQVVDTDGEVVANAYGKVVKIAFDDKYDADGELVQTERVHGLKVT